MLRKSDAQRKYQSANTRFIKPLIEEFFNNEFPNMFGPNLRSKIADELLNIFYQNHRDVSTIKPGQILWNVVHKNTRADSPNRKLVPVILTIIDQQNIDNLANGMTVVRNRQDIIARITQEAYAQDGLLSMRDIGLLMAQDPSHISAQRKQFEQSNNISLPHTGSLHDMGTCITHKYQIVYKYVVEKKDPVVISNETNHTLKAVDNYLKDYGRVKLLVNDNKSPEFIKLATGIPLHVIKQYLSIINQYDKEKNAS